MFLIGGLSGIYLGTVPIDIHASDTYYIVAHIHYVLYGGSVFTIFAGRLLLVPEDDRANVLGDARQVALLADVHRVQRDVLPHALDRAAGTASPHGRLHPALRRLEPLHLHLGVRPRRLDALLPLQHDQELGARPGAGSNPWRAHSIEWQVSSPPPLFNFDEIPQVVGGPYEYGVPGARHAVFSEDGAAKHEEEAVSEGGRGAADDARARGRERDGRRQEPHRGARADAPPRARVRITVVCPISSPREGLVVYEDTRRASARRRLDKTLDLLRTHGIAADGFVVDADPVDVVRDAFSQLVPPPDAVVVSTHPQARSGWLRRDVVERIRAAVDVPVEHVVVDLHEEDGEDNVLVIANQTVVGAPLLDAIRERARRSPASFLIVSPESDLGPSGDPDAERRLRQAVGILRSEGIDVHGQLGHPDPYTAAMQAIYDERTDELIVSTFPGTKSGWLRSDLVGRLRKDTKLPVTHVESEPLRPRRSPDGSARRRSRARRTGTASTRRPRTSPRAWTRACSGCCSSSARRSCSSGRSSPRTSSCASSTATRGRRRAVTCRSSWPA